MKKVKINRSGLIGDKLEELELLCLLWAMGFEVNWVFDISTAWSYY